MPMMALHAYCQIRMLYSPFFGAPGILLPLPDAGWGAQWAQLNSLSGGGAPASFEGFAASPSTPSCGAS